MKPFVEPPDPLIGASIEGRYTVHAVLGRGGMGVVYEGVHEQLGRPVAIKVMAAGISRDPVAVERFLREARTASTLTHGNIVDVSDLGQLPDGRPFFVMPKLDGEDLCALLHRLGPQPPARVVELLRGAAAALDLIHAKGMVHRDVKPENLMHVVREDGSEAVLLLDFGIVGLMASNAARLTAEGSIFGTPAYLPPEIVESNQPDRRGDIYALATVAFELMTGKLPFDSDNPHKILPMKLMNAAPRMSSVGTRKFPEPIEAVIARGMSHDPAGRQSSAGAFVAALDAAVKESAHATQLEQDANIPTLTERTQASTAELELSLTQNGPLSMLVPQTPARVQPSEVSVQTGRRRGPLLVAVGGGLALLAVGVLSLRPSTPGAPSVTPRAPPSAAAEKPVPPLASPAAAASAAEHAAPAANAPSLQPAADAPAGVTATATLQPPKPPSATAALQPAKPPPASAAARRAGTARAAAAPRAARPAEPVPTPAAVAAAPTGPGTAELNQAATQSLLQGHPAQAAELYGRAVKIDPRNEAAWRGLGLTSERLGHTDDAVRAFRHALALSPQGPNAETIRARLEKLGAAP